MDGGKVRVSRAVYLGLEAVRQSGKVDMLDQPGIIALARLLGFEETARYIETHQREYAAGALVRGFQPEDD